MVDNQEKQTPLLLPKPRIQSQESQDRNSKEKFWTICAISVIILNVVFLVILIAIAVTWKLEFMSPDRYDLNQMYCIECSKVNDSAPVYDVKGDKCCGKASDIINDLVNKKIGINHEEEKARDRYFSDYLHCHDENKKSRPATRMVGIYNPTETNSNELKWGKDESLSFEHNDIKYKAGKLVPYGQGTYYLYSQITVNLNETMTIPIVHTMYRLRFRDGVSEKLLEGSISNCQLSVNSSDSTSYLGASFMLDDGDQISVKITHPFKIKYKSMAGNYFGMHKI